LPLVGFGQFCDSLLLQSITNPGPFIVADIDENSGVRNGPNYNGSTIYFPLNSPVTNLSSVILVPGFMNFETTIQNWGPFLASHGIITMTIGTNALTDTHVQRRDALLDAITSLKNENQRLGSPLYGKIDTSSIAVGGFSKGGGGAQLVPSIDSSVKAVVALYPWLDNPVASDLSHSVPVIIISGQLDIIAPPSLHADVHYNLTPNITEKLKYEIALASHDAISGPYAGTGEVGIRVLSWLNTFLLGDTCYCPIIIEDASTSSSYITNVICSEIVVGTNNLGDHYLKRLISVRDLFGREVNTQNNTLLFYIYDDGSVEKKIIIE
jgi:hypothetical protein